LHDGSLRPIRYASRSSKDIERSPNALGVKDEACHLRVEHGAYRDGIKFGNGKEISSSFSAPASLPHWLQRRKSLKATASGGSFSKQWNNSSQ
jgi:hypothetical protein